MDTEEKMDFAGMEQDEVISLIIEAKAKKKWWSTIISMAESEILFRNKSNIEKELGKRDEPFGTFTANGIKFNAPKTVIWDQEQLGELYKRIKDDGANPDEYIKVTTKYSVSESEYKKWAQDIKDHFIGARIVKQGTIKINIGEE